MTLGLTRSQVRAFLGVILTMDAFVVGCLVGFTASPVLGIILGGSMLLLPVIIFRTIVPTVAGAVGWWTLQRVYPPAGAPVFDDKAPLTSVSLRSQFVGMNNCIETAQDEDYLHLRIFGLLGPPMMPISIPWAAMTTIIVPRRGVAAVTLDQGPRLWFPEKLLAREIELRKELAETEHPGEPQSP